MSRKRILVVDDEKACCELLKDYFVKQNFIVDVVSDGKEAQSLLQNNKYEYIIFDYSMPCFSGADLAEVIAEKNPQAKKILISGYDLANDEVAQDIGADVFLRKPFVMEDLGAIVKDE
ncbi:MAG: response regulator [Candidatus Omnitrophota bacterium]